MPVNFTSNGKVIKHTLLVDSERLKKELEDEKRKARLLQVREASKDFARKVRNSVAEEKQKQLEKLEATKAMEMKLWRQRILAEQNNENCEAVFHIGDAHRAAQAEKKRMKELEKAKQGGMSVELRNRSALRKSNIENVPNNGKCFGKCMCANVKVLPVTHPKCSCGQTEKKRKRDCSFSSSDSDSDLDTSFDNSITISSIISVTNLEPSTEAKATQTSVQIISLNRTPAILLDVEDATDDSLAAVGAIQEINDNHTESNRQFTKVVRVSPSKMASKDGKIDAATSTRDIPQSREKLTERSQIQRTEIITTTTEDQNSSKQIELSNQTAAVQKEKRFTLISDLVRKQQETPFCRFKPTHERRCDELAQNNNAPTINSNFIPRTFGSTQDRGNFESIQNNTSPTKRLNLPTRPTTQKPITNERDKSPRKGTASSKSSRFGTEAPSWPTTSKGVSSGNTAVTGSGSMTFGKVQFYDYSSKSCRDGPPKQTQPLVQKQTDYMSLTAMQQASLENQLQKERQFEALRRSQQTEERGQKALEKELVRRDCHELTEKLDALTNQYSKSLPNNNYIQSAPDKRLRNEGKMNIALEKLLNRPTVITCPEINDNQLPIKTTNIQRNKERSNILNLGAANVNNSPDNLSSSESCCSILLGYVDEQSKQVRKDIEQWTDNESDAKQEKQKRLKNLLQRLDQLRNCLMEEIGNTNVADKESNASKNENVRKAINCISGLRKERENILAQDVPKSEKKFKLRERELQQKEAILEEKLKEFYDLQKKSKTSLINAKASTETVSTEKITREASNDKPLEIVITVKGESHRIRVPGISKKDSVKKTPAKVSATLIRSSHTKGATSIRTPTKKRLILDKQKPAMEKPSMGKQNSYDSSSTSYMSLPATIPNRVNEIAQLAREQKTVTEPAPSNRMESVTEAPPRVNPLVAQYIQRLLGMSRKAVNSLGVSSSDISTPASSIINTSGNMSTNMANMSEEKLAYVQSFIEENRSFLKELEQSIRSQNNVSLDSSMRAFDEIWRKRLASTKQKKSEKTKEAKKAMQKDDMPTIKPKSHNDYSRKTPKKILPDKIATKTSNNAVSPISISSSDDTNKAQVQKNVPRNLNKTNLEPENTRKKSNKKDKIIAAAQTSNTSEPDAQIKRYAKLTENCTQRIAELTELINRVREEKQRLLEVTLTSVSDNERHSTEYLELPPTVKSTTVQSTHSAEVSITESTEVPERSKTTTSSDRMPSSKDNTTHIALDKNRQQITASRDSGIYESRPTTSQGNPIDIEPVSQTSADSQSASQQQQRKIKPPPTLRRFSPQLLEEDVAHELSTILEVDTPATSRLNTAVEPASDEQANAAQNPRQQPIRFPTFEQYIQRMNLDLTQLDPEQSVRLQQDFYNYIEALQENPEQPDFKYNEFPSMSAYMEKLTQMGQQQNGDNFEQSITKIRLNSIQPQHFPAVREYLQSIATSTTSDQHLLDTESLENVTNTENDNESTSIDIEKELKRRQILKHSFQYIKSKEMFSSTAKLDTELNNMHTFMPAESGVDKLSTSDDTMTNLENELKQLVGKWPANMKNAKRPNELILSSTTTSTTSDEKFPKTKVPTTTPADDSSKQHGQPINIREFITRELMKYANFSASTTSSSCDDSIRSHFLHSIIGTITPQTGGSKSVAHTIDRQKTSTPVPQQVTNSHGSVSAAGSSSEPISATQLFSGESRLSSVHYRSHDRTVRFFTSDGDNYADHSSE